MKNAFVILAALAASSSAFAADQGPMISKSSGAGFVLPEYQRFEGCKVFADKVVIEHGFGDLRTREERNVRITGDLGAMIARAQAETAEERPNGLCDGPATSVMALPDAADRDNFVVLFQTGGCGSPRTERQGPASRALRNLVDQYCPTTHDFARDR